MGAVGSGGGGGGGGRGRAAVLCWGWGWGRGWGGGERKVLHDAATPHAQVAVPALALCVPVLLYLAQLHTIAQQRVGYSPCCPCCPCCPCFCCPCFCCPCCCPCSSRVGGRAGAGVTKSPQPSLQGPATVGVKPISHCTKAHALPRRSESLRLCCRLLSAGQGRGGARPL